MTVPINKGVPIPEKRRRFADDYPWEDMGVGDSIFIPFRGKSRPQVSVVQKRLGVKFTTRRLTEDDVLGLRIWRIE